MGTVIDIYYLFILVLLAAKSIDIIVSRKVIVGTMLMTIEVIYA
jgi:hypothetical protein